MITLDEVYSYLVPFGLDKIDSKLYVGLLQNGAISVGTISSILEIDRGKTYRSLKKLKEIGLVTTTLSNPATISPITPKEAFTLIIERKKDKIISLQKLSKSLIPDLKSFERPIIDTTVSSLAIVQGRSNIYSRIGILIQKYRSIYIVSTIRDLLRMYYTAIPEKIKLCIENDGKVNLITEQCNAEEFSLLKKLNVSEIRIGKLPSKSRIIAAKEGNLIMSGHIGESESSSIDNDSVICTNSLEMSSNMYLFCTQLWKHAKPLEICA